MGRGLQPWRPLLALCNLKLCSTPLLPDPGSESISEAGREGGQRAHQRGADSGRSGRGVCSTNKYEKERLVRTSMENRWHSIYLRAPEGVAIVDKDAVESISNTIADYRLGEITPRSSKVVELWAKQRARRERRERHEDRQMAMDAEGGPG